MNVLYDIGINKVRLTFPFATIRHQDRGCSRIEYNKTENYKTGLFRVKLTSQPTIHSRLDVEFAADIREMLAQVLEG